MSPFTFLALGCTVAAAAASFQRVDARFMALTWGLLAIAASVLALGGLR